MAETIENIPPDIGLIHEVIIDLNISRRNIKTYPRDHPAVQKSLNRVYEAFKRLFERRPQNTLAVGKDTLIADNYTLDRKNTIYRQLAQDLRRLGIAYITFYQGLTMDDLYKFNFFISSQEGYMSHGDIRQTLSNYGLSHIEVGFIDYEAFSFEEGKTVQEISQEDLWEQYISALLTGTLKVEEIAEEIGKISLEELAKLLRRVSESRIDRGLCRKIIAVYIKKLLQRPLPGEEIKKLLAFMDKLPQDLNEQFSQSAVDVLSEDISMTTKLLQNISADAVIELFKAVGSQKVTIPETLRNLLDKFLRSDERPLEYTVLGGNFLVDDIFLPADSLDKSPKVNLNEAITDTFDTSMSVEYEEEIKKILESNISEAAAITLRDLKKEIDDDFIQRNLNLIILELMSSNLISEKEYIQFIESLREQSVQFVWTGQYGQVLQTIKLLRLNIEQNRFPGITSEALKYYYGQEFLSAFMDSLKIMGKQSRDEAWQLCENYGEIIIPLLMDMLTREDSPTFRSLLLGLIRQFGDAIVPEALKRLDDTRWFVKRNMIYLLNGCNNKEVIPFVKKYCRHENQKVSFEAIKCLLGMEDPYGIDVIREYLFSHSKELVEQAISLAGAFRIKETVPDLIKMLEEMGTNKANLPQKISVIQALGNIGDSRSLDAFRKIIFSRSLFFRGLTEKLKEEVYKTLRNYPYNDVEDIIRAGLKSRNDYIKSESLRLSMMRKR
jgi:flagellar motor component MotA